MLRRAFLLEPGESLLVPHDPLQTLANHIATATATGLSQSQLVASRMSRVPVPQNSGRMGARRAPGIQPESMWWPLLWLPERLTRRVEYHVIDNDLVVVDPDGLFAGDPRTTTAPIDGYDLHRETTDVWVIRVLMEIEAADLYDPDDGTWADVLSGVGINIDSPSGRRRIERWLEGEPDEALDDLNAHFLNDGHHFPDGETPTWAFRSAVAIYNDLLDAAWTYGSEALRAIVEDVTNGIRVGGVEATGEGRYAARLVCQLSESLLQWYSDGESDWWRRMIDVVEAFDGTEEQMIDGVLSDIDRRLEEVNRVTRSRMESAIERYGA